MRIAQRMISRNYMRDLNRTLKKRSDAFERGTSGLAFDKLSQNVASGARAMKIQEERNRAERQLDTVQDLRKEMNSVDSNLDSIDAILQSVQEKVLKAINQAGGDVQREALAKEIGSKKEQILQFANAQYGGKFLFSGTNNAEPPFSEKNGKLCFNGVPMEDITYDPATEKYMYPNPNGGTPAQLEVPESGSVYVDIGLGIKIDGNSNVDKRSAFKISFSGMEVLGFGKQVDGSKNGTKVSQNAYDLLGQIEEALNKGDATALDDLALQLTKVNDTMRNNSRVDLGTRMDFLERSENRLENDITNLSETESFLVSSDPAQEAISLKESEYTWMAVLQLGSKLLPSSLLDFLR